MTTKDIMDLCPKAENITVTPEGTVGMKVGYFAQAINVNFNKDKKDVEHLIKGLYLDLQAMNRQTDAQIAEAGK